MFNNYQEDSERNQFNEKSYLKIKKIKRKLSLQ